MSSKVMLVVLLAAVLVTAACGASADGPPDIQVDRTACSHCTMLISEPRYAAAYRAAGAEPRVFDDIGCLREAARSETTKPQRFWFRDANDAQWIEGADVTFVRSPGIRTPMSGGIAAYRDRAAAEKAAADHRGTIITSVSDLLAQEGR